MTRIIEVDNTEQSYEMGRFLGIMRQMEEELHFIDQSHHPREVDRSIPHFIKNPAQALDECQINLIHSQKLVKEMGKPELLEDIREVFELIDVPFLSEISLHPDNFMKGYQAQRMAYK